MKNNSLFAENSDFNLGDYGAAGTTGTLTIQDNAQIIMIGVNNGVFVGKSAGAIGTVTQTGGTIDARKAGVFQLGQQAGSVGTWLQSGGTTYAGGWASIGRGYTSGDLSPMGLLVVSGGLFDQTSAGNGLLVGEQGTGTLTISNAGVVVSEANNIGVAIGWNQGVGTLNLDNGGTLVANFVQGGSGSSTFNFNGGVLRAGPGARVNFMTNLSSALVLAGAVIDTGTNTIDIGQPLLDGGMGGGLAKNGAGTLMLDGANTYSGTTTISGGTFGGNGTLAGTLVVQSGATLSPGASIGALTVNNTINLAAGSRTVMELSKAASTNDHVLGATSLTYGGTLVLTNLAGTLAVNDSFALFAAGSYHGAFSSVVSETPGQIVTWDLSQLAVNGTVKVATAAPTQVTISSVVSGTNLTLSWPANQTGGTLQEQINPVTVGLSTNWVTVPGSTVTNQMTFPIVPTNGTVFFRLLF
jgi:autotransporter-associated beta strand protein